MLSKHTIVWLDRQEAHIFHVQPEAFAETAVRAPARHLHRIRKVRANPKRILRMQSASSMRWRPRCKGLKKILPVGPGTAKLHFLRYARKHQPALESKIFGVETVDHPTDNQLVGYAGHYFTAADRIR